MNDTSPEMEEMYRQLLMSRSGSDRLKMASGMFDTARTLARANLESQCYSEEEVKSRLFKRIYGTDFDQVTMTKILAGLSIST